MSIDRGEIGVPRHRFRHTVAMAPPPDRPARPGRSVTLADVARRVGVSGRTVSRVVNDEGGCTPETRERILAAIEELGYRPNLLARSLIRRRSDTIGLMATKLDDPFFPEVAEGVQAAVHRLGKTMFLASSDNDPARQYQALDSLRSHGVDGVIVFPAGDDRDGLVRLAAEGLPIVVINDEVSAPGLASVRADIQHGAELAVEHLVASGRTRIAMVADSRSHHSPRGSRRELGYRTVIERSGLTMPDDTVWPEANSLVGGRRAAEAMLDHGSRPDAIFAYNDLMALGALQTLLARGIRVPDDIALVGFDDITMCEVVTPQLTSVRIDRDVLGQTAVEALQDLLDDPGSSPATRLLAVSLVVRGSS